MKKYSLALSVTILALLTLSAQAGDIYHQRGVEFRGGLSMYMMMEDPVDWAEQITPNLDQQMENAPDFGFSLLYKSHKNFVWNIGYNHLLSSKVTYTLGGIDYDETVSASEIFLALGFIFWPEQNLNFSINAGPSLIMASLDRYAPAFISGDMQEFYDATGRNLGFLGVLNIEYGLSKNFALKIGGGFRAAIINDIGFVKTVNGQDVSYPIVWTDAQGNETTRSYELDFTGVFVEVGLRWYFEPKRIW